MPRTGRRGRWPPHLGMRSRWCRGSGGRSDWPAQTGFVEAVQGPAVRRQGPRHRRALPRSTRAGAGAVRGREDPDPGTQPHRTGVPDAARHPGAGQPRLRPPRHLQPVRRAGPGHRQGHRLAARPPPRHRVPGVPDARSTPKCPPISTCTWCSTTPPPTRPRRSSAGCPHIRGSSCTSPRPVSSWLNLVERWFAELTTKKLRRGTHTSVRRTQHRHPRLDRHLERQPATLRLDQDRRPHAPLGPGNGPGWWPPCPTAARSGGPRSARPTTTWPRPRPDPAPHRLSPDGP